MPESLRQLLFRSRDVVRTEIWPLPVLAILLAVVGGVLLPLLDKHVDGGLSPHVTAYLFGGGVDAARKILSSIASSLITVTSLTFSLTVVTLQLASSQFSPRLLRTFTRDRFVHITLGLFLGTFTYVLTVLRTVSDATGQNAFVPQISITLGYVLAVLSVLGLVLFLAHLAREIRVETTLRNVHISASRTVRATLELRPDEPREPVPTRPDHAFPLLAGSSGFLVGVDGAALVTAAAKAGAVVWLDRLPGDSLVEGTPVGWCWGNDGMLPVDRRDALPKHAIACVSVGYERNESQDVAYGLRQLTDVAVKALSPGINDPTTADHALGHSAALLCELADYDLGPKVLRDEHGTVRALLRRPDLAELLELAVNQPRRYGEADPLVLGRLATLLRELAWRVSTAEHRQAVADQLRRLRATVDGQDFDAIESERLAELTASVDRTLSGDLS